MPGRARGRGCCSAGVEVAELTAAGAVEVGLLGAPLAVGQVVREARAMLGVVVTRVPAQYGQSDTAAAAF